MSESFLARPVAWSARAWPVARAAFKRYERPARVACWLASQMLAGAVWLTCACFVAFFVVIASEDAALMDYVRPAFAVAKSIALLVAGDLGRAWGLLHAVPYIFLPSILQTPASLLLFCFVVYGAARLLLPSKRTGG
jgi:hypothetical protein